MKTASVTVNWGSPSDTIVALHSLASMSSPPDVIICVDNGSAIEHRLALRAGMPTGTVLIELEENLGVAGANNAGLGYALDHGIDWTLLLNNDAVVSRSCLERCIASLDAVERVAIVGPAVTFLDEPDVLWFAGGAVNRWLAYPRHPALRQPARSLPPTSDTGYVPGCCALVSSEALRDVGLFRVDYFMYYEDAEWCQRARDAGWRCRYLGEILCAHAVSASAGTRGSLGLTETMAYYLARNPLRFALETDARTRRFSRVAGLLTVYLAFNIQRAIHTRQPAVAKAYLEGLLDAMRGRMGPRLRR